jgi:hypothetical protein
MAPVAVDAPEHQEQVACGLHPGRIEVFVAGAHATPALGPLNSARVQYNRSMGLQGLT